MTNGKNVTILMLLMSAVVLSALLLAAIRTDPAQAANTSARLDPYIMTTGGRADTADNIYIIDIYQKRLNVYTADPNRDRLDAMDSVDLTQYFRNQ